MLVRIQGGKEPAHTVGRNVNWCNHMGISMESPQTDLPYDPILYFGIYPNIYQHIRKRDTCTLMFIAAVFTIAKLWNQQGAQQ
jgi:hypothetical protein